ncbi:MULTISPECIES: KpsF/GutQ family sugar-phosphate isomerase [Vibrio]|jgi:arabinose-5-phosphate isomerase|uniref:Arabinose 5-phosphate isomerase n=1 Tax=Vibrio bivalvicida TaxID=1276888 RepID=A0ABV4MQK3_9VIBR|nr:KpsF/GutQ family sugar-phosphate isomerase [Vibrio aestuarianus]NGZ69057.1 KpsF/GutQ family sugar-phosphate isomerase [Vibrio aestuarianus subsp. cardii]
MKNIQVARSVINNQIDGLKALCENIDDNFSLCVQEIIKSSGRVVLSGVGKSGIIAKKISASLASTGTPSFYIHPNEAFHGDLGMIKDEDIIIAISNSGESTELIGILPFLKSNGNKIISVTGNQNSTLADNADFKLNISVPSEACPLNLAPTTSTTATLVLGDALTVALMEEREFSPEQYARFHPGGALGRRLTKQVSDVMITNDIPYLDSETSFSDMIYKISSRGIGLGLIMHNNQSYIITDGDIRRAIEKYKEKVFQVSILEIATASPKFISPDCKLYKAYEVMERNLINSLVVKIDNKIVGVIKK